MPQGTGVFAILHEECVAEPRWGSSTVQEMCVSRPLVMRGIFARKRENRENAKTARTGKRRGD